jgi:hypothetical protein
VKLNGVLERINNSLRWLACVSGWELLDTKPRNFQSLMSNLYKVS